MDRDSPLPLWAQVLEDLRRRIVAGDFAERFPTDEDLTAAYGVSRQTAREAVRRLQADGVVERHRGRGSTLRGPVVEQPLRALYSLARSVEHHGLAEHNDILRHERQVAGNEVAEALGGSASDPVLFLERLRFAGDDPLSLERSWIPWAIGRRLVRRDLRHGSLYDVIYEASGLRVSAGVERIAPVVPPAQDRKLLALPRSVAAFAIERRARAGDVVVELRRATVRGDRYRFVAEWP